MKEKETEPCLSCKIISVGCFLGIGGYLIYQGKLQMKHRYILYGLGTGK